jgi:hypothetical protein
MLFQLVVVIAMAGATWIVGWWGVVLVALVAGFLYRAQDGRALLVALCASESWVIFFLIDAAAGPLGRVATTVAALVKLPTVILLVTTLLFPAVLAWSAAALASEVGRFFRNTAATPLDSRASTMHH